MIVQRDAYERPRPLLAWVAHRLLVRLGFRIDHEAIARAIGEGFERGVRAAQAKAVRDEWAERTAELKEELRTKA